MPAGSDSRTQRSRMPDTIRYTSRRGCLQRALSPRSWLRSCRRANPGHLARHRPRRRTRRPDHRIHNPSRLLWPLHIGDEFGHTSTAGFGRGLCRPGNSCPFAQQRFVAVVPAEWSSRCRAHDADERRALQRSGWRLVAIGGVLVSHRHAGWQAKSLIDGAAVPTTARPASPPRSMAEDAA